MQATNERPLHVNQNLRQDIKSHVWHWATRVFVWTIFSMFSSNIFDYMELSWLACKLLYVAYGILCATHVVLTLATDIEQICAKHSKR
jgi:hypothetical protein